MNVNITINGDILIHFECCEDCGDFREDDYENESEMRDESTELPPEEAESVLKAVAELIFPLLQEDSDE